ncbi:threonine aldolase family protein [Bryobacter aggregatus]|uniref:threonine aldolase family protein n=1 Tax=Bryobacter aggregatus TaxID=360054 RepID=UPI0004E0B13D|nr:GntG family PLP-dependent aldolase [Bryobacter aggregatus]
MDLIDLRSDTVTKPTPEMREAMAGAEVGDDVYGEDPTVNRLEERSAEIVGKEAALFVPTGLMGNMIGLKVHTEHGQEVICDSRSHIQNYELSMLAWFSGCLTRAIPTSDGILDWASVQREYRPAGLHWASTGVIEVENTHNVGGGTVYPQARLDEICDGAHALGLPVHMDGARIFNAATALGTPVGAIAAKLDTVMFCLSKGLGAPVGSILVGPRKLIEKGRTYRKRLGGGMRQAGILAAAGLIALEKMPQRLGEDHANAQRLAQRLAKMPGIRIDPSSVQTNIVIFDVAATPYDAAAFSAKMKERGVLMSAFGPTLVRIVTHYDVPRAACETAAEKIEEMLKAA